MMSTSSSQSSSNPSSLPLPLPPNKVASSSASLSSSKLPRSSSLADDRPFELVALFLTGLLAAGCLGTSSSCLSLCLLAALAATLCCLAWAARCFFLSLSGMVAFGPLLVRAILGCVALSNFFKRSAYKKTQRESIHVRIIEYHLRLLGDIVMLYLLTSSGLVSLLQFPSSPG